MVADTAQPFKASRELKERESVDDTTSQDLGCIESKETKTATGPPFCEALILINSLVFVSFVAYVLCFCVLHYGNFTIGYGFEVFNFLYKYRSYALPTALFSIILIVLLIVFDIRHWRGRILRTLGCFLILLCVAAVSAALLLSTGTYEFAPFALFFVFVPAVLMGFYSAFFLKVDRLAVIGSLLWTLFLISVVMLGLWLQWLFVEGMYWDDCTKVVYYSRLDVCGYNGTVYNHTEKMLSGSCSLGDTQFCTTAFIIWLAPFILVLFSLCFALILYFLVRAERRRRLHPASKITIDPLAQVFISFIMLGILGLWIAASITGASSELGSAVLALSFLGVLVATALAISIFGLQTLSDQLKLTPLGKKGAEFCHSDYGRALVVLALAPVFLVHMLLNVVTQWVRKNTFIGKTIESENEAKSCFTARTDKLVKKVINWKWGSVIVISLWWGIFYFVFFVGVTRFTTVFLSFLNEQLSNLSLGLTIGIFVIIGLVMFLLPPVPGIGVPVYVTGGIVLTSNAEYSGLSFGYGLLVAIAVCFGLKLLALIMQQKLIGELFGARSVYIRYLVGINSVEMRAIKAVLSEKGFTLSKVVVLVGGPDWPTSVLTGIMRLSVLQMLLGTLPVIFLIAPSCIAGAMLYKSNTNSLFSSLEIISVGVAVIVQTAALLGAFHFVAKAAVEREKELESIDPDYEVVQYEKRRKHLRSVYQSLYSWQSLHKLIKALHILALILMIFACYCFQLFGSRCFVEFAITDSIDEKLNGNPLNLVTDFGKIPSFAFTASAAYLFVFTIVQRIRASSRKRAVKNADDSVDLDEEQSIVIT